MLQPFLFWQCKKKMATGIVYWSIGQKDVLSPDVLSLRRFCPHGRFVPKDVLSLRMFCPYGRFVPRTLCLRPFCLRRFCLRMFCPYGRFVSGRFVWAPVSNPLENFLQGVRGYWQPSGKFVTGCQKLLATLWQILQRVLTNFANSTYLPEGCQHPLILG
jgi:hypothetical protein